MPSSTELPPPATTELERFYQSIEHLPEMGRIEALLHKSLELQLDSIQGNRGRRTGTAGQLRSLAQGEIGGHIEVPRQSTTSLRASAARAKIKIKIERINPQTQRVTKLADMTGQEFAASGEGSRRLVQLVRKALAKGELRVARRHAPDSDADAGGFVALKDLRYSHGGRMSIVAFDGRDYPYEPNTDILTQSGDSLLAKL